MSEIDRGGGPTPGSHAALLEAWSRRFRKPLLSYFRRRTAPGVDCEDLVQEVFLKLARREDLAVIERVDSYLFEVAANVLTDWRRKQQTHAAGAHFEIPDEFPSADFSPQRVLEGKDGLRAVVAALGDLPERTRIVFMLYHFEHLPQADIGRRLGIALRTVEDHMQRAHAKLLSSIYRPDVD